MTCNGQGIWRKCYEAMLYIMKTFREHSQAQHPENHMPKAKLTSPGPATSLSGALSGCPSEALRLVVLRTDAGNTAAITSNNCMDVHPKCGSAAAITAPLGYNAQAYEFAASLEGIAGNSLTFVVGPHARAIRTTEGKRLSDIIANVSTTMATSTGSWANSAGLASAALPQNSAASTCH